MPTILVVEDSEVDRCLVQGLLEQESDFTLRYAPDGAQGLREIRREAPDLVLTDLQMPEVNGLELVSQARGDFPLLPFILMTSQGSESIAVQALQGGASSYVPKDSLADNLVDTVRRVLTLSTQAKVQSTLLSHLTRQHAEFSLENDPQLVSSLVAHLQDETGMMEICDESDRVRVGIALEEALVNALYHGNLEVDSELKESDSPEYREQIRVRRETAPYCDRRIHVNVELVRGVEAQFTITDEGSGFDPGDLPDPTDPANLERLCGRGILLMRTFMDEVSHDNGGRTVRLVKRRRPRPEL